MAFKKSKRDLPKVGEGGAGRAPTAPVSSNKGGEKSRWWKTQKSTAQDPGFERLSPHWANSATGEMEKFKHVPVVGRLPWRLQYIVAAIGLVMGVVIMGLLVANLSNGRDQEGLRKSSELSLRQALSNVEQGLWLARMEPETARSVLNSALSTGSSAMRSWVDTSPGRAQMVQAEWSKTTEMVQQVNSLLPHAVALRKSANQAAPLIAGGIARANAVLEAAPQQDSAEVKAFLMSMTLWDNGLDRVIEDGGKWPVSVSRLRPGMNASVNAFSSSPQATQNSASSNAWRQAGSAWAQASPATQSVVNSAAAWNKLVDLDKLTRTQVAKTVAASAAASEAGGSAAWLIPATLLAGAWVVVCLLLLMGIGWKQQRFQALAALAAHEQTELGILNMMEDLRLIADGDLTHRARVSETPVGTMADMLNETVAKLAGLVQDIKKHVERGAAASQNAAAATGALVDSAREDQGALVQSGKEIAKVVSGIQEVANISEQTDSLTNEAMSSAAEGRSAVSEAHSYLLEIRVQSEEARNRVERLALSSREISGIATLMNELADTIGVLSMQAALQAARAGEKGQGFRVVADGVGDLAQRSGVAARRVGSLIEAALGDIEGAAASMRAATKGTDESTRLMDISLENSQVTEEALVKVTSSMGALLSVLTEQRNSAQALDVNAKESLSRVQDSQERAQAAAEGVMQLFDSSREMAASANRFKV